MAGEKAKKKAASKPSKPSCFAMVCAAIKAKKGTFGKGVSRAFIYSHIGDNHSGTAVAAVRRAMSKAMDAGLLEHGSTNQRFKLTEAGKAKAAPPKPKKKKKKAKKRPAKKKRKKTKKRKTSKKKKAKKRTKAKRKSSKKSGKRRTAKRKSKRRAAKKRRASAK